MCVVRVHYFRIDTLPQLTNRSALEVGKGKLKFFPADEIQVSRSAESLSYEVPCVLQAEILQNPYKSPLTDVSLPPQYCTQRQ